MLTEEELKKVNYLRRLVKSLGVSQWSFELNHENVAWLCNKLVETHNELNSTKEQLKTSEDSYAMALEEIEKFEEELKTANIYSATVAKELQDLQKKHQELDKMLATALHVIQDAGIMDEYLKFRNQ